MSEEELKVACRKWQKILRLEHWDVEICFARQCGVQDSDGNDVDARCFPVLSRLEAKIKILAPQDFTGERLEHAGSPQDLEILVIHELLHLHFEPFWDDSRTREMEQAIHSLAKSFQSFSPST